MTRCVDMGRNENSVTEGGCIDSPQFVFQQDDAAVHGTIYSRTKSKRTILSDKQSEPQYKGKHKERIEKEILKGTV